MLGIIGGTGLGSLSNLQDVTAEQVATDFGSAYVEQGKIDYLRHPPPNG
ncbi:MAG: hypothetical protein ACE37D_20030 [Pseudomonadales bacterium]